MSTHPKSRKASLQAYTKLVVEGRLSKSRKQVYACVYNNGPIDQLRAHDLLRTGGAIAWSTVSGRFSELLQMGLLEIVGETTNRRGNVVTLWDVTDRLVPFVLPKRRTRRLPDGTMDWKDRSRRLEAFGRSMLGWLHKNGHRGMALRGWKKLNEILQ